MREFAFTITYERGADHLMDVFIDHPGLYARTVSCHATEDTMWRLDEVTGPVAGPMGACALAGLRARTWLAEHGDDELLSTAWRTPWVL